MSPPICKGGRCRYISDAVYYYRTGPYKPWIPMCVKCAMHHATVYLAVWADHAGPFLKPIPESGR